MSNIVVLKNSAIYKVWYVMNEIIHMNLGLKN